MKLLLVLGDDDTYKLITHYIKPLGFEFIRYTHVLKAMDSIDEIDPNAVIISARDFPRHWKIMTKFIRDERAKDVCPLIILKGKDFPVEEASKASFLGASGIVPENLDNFTDINRLQGILSRYIPLNEKRRIRRHHTEHWQRFGFVFNRPDNGVLITGAVRDISSGGLSFLPDNSLILNGLTGNTELGNCSLRTGDAILSPVCQITRMGRTISMMFLSFPEGEHEILSKYLEKLPLMELERIKRGQMG